MVCILAVIWTLRRWWGRLAPGVTGGFREIGSYSEVWRRKGGVVTIAVEEKRLRSLFERVEVVEDVARTLPEDDERRARLLAVSDSALAEEGTVRPVIAARLLGLSEKTVRAWAAAGVLAVARRSPGCCWTCAACTRSVTWSAS